MSLPILLEWTEQTPPDLLQLHWEGDIIIGNDVWMGRNSIIMPGVEIGDGAIIGHILWLQRMLNLTV